MHTVDESSVGDGEAKSLQRMESCASPYESRRLRVLHKVTLLDSMNDGCYSRYLRIAARSLKAPMAVISLVDMDIIHLKSGVGLTEKQASLDSLFCAQVVDEQSDGELLIKDTLENPQHSNFHWVAGPQRIRFYASAALVVEGARIGTLCVLDTVPRQDISSHHMRILRDLAALIVSLLEQRINLPMEVHHSLAQLSTTVIDCLQAPLRSLTDNCAAAKLLAHTSPVLLTNLAMRMHATVLQLQSMLEAGLRLVAETVALPSQTGSVRLACAHGGDRTEGDWLNLLRTVVLDFSRSIGMRHVQWVGEDAGLHTDRRPLIPTQSCSSLVACSTEGTLSRKSDHTASRKTDGTLSSKSEAESGGQRYAVDLYRLQVVLAAVLANCAPHWQRVQLRAQICEADGLSIDGSDGLQSRKTGPTPLATGGDPSRPSPAGWWPLAWCWSPLAKAVEHRPPSPTAESSFLVVTLTAQGRATQAPRGASTGSSSLEAVLRHVLSVCHSHVLHTTSLSSDGDREEWTVALRCAKVADSDADRKLLLGMGLAWDCVHDVVNGPPPSHPLGGDSEGSRWSWRRLGRRWKRFQALFHRSGLIVPLD